MSIKGSPNMTLSPKIKMNIGNGTLHNINTVYKNRLEKCKQEPESDNIQVTPHIPFPT